MSPDKTPAETAWSEPETCSSWTARGTGLHTNFETLKHLSHDPRGIERCLYYFTKYDIRTPSQTFYHISAVLYPYTGNLPYQPFPTTDCDIRHGAQTLRLEVLYPLAPSSPFLMRRMGSENAYAPFSAPPVFLATSLSTFSKSPNVDMHSRTLSTGHASTLPL